MEFDVVRPRGTLERRAAALALLLALTVAGGVQGQTVSDFVAGSARSANPVILTILLGPDTTQAIAAARALAKRKDPYVGDLLSALFARVTGPASYRATLLVRMVLEYDFLLPVPRPARIAANRAELSVLLGQLQSVPDAETKGALLEVSRYLAAGASAKALPDEGAFLGRYLESSGGRFTPDRLDEALAFLGACRAHTNQVLRSEVVRLVEAATDATFVRAARGYLAATR